MQSYVQPPTPIAATTGMKSRGCGKAIAGRDVLFNIVDQLAHVRVIDALADDVERLQQRHAGFHHGRHLPREQGDVHGRNLFAGAEQ